MKDIPVIWWKVNLRYAQHHGLHPGNFDMQVTALVFVVHALQAGSLAGTEPIWDAGSA